MSQPHSLAIWIVSAATIAAILLRPARIGEWVWAVFGAAILVAAGLLPLSAAGTAARDGVDVYLFLGGMLALAELGRVHGVFEWLSALLMPMARGKGSRVFICAFAGAIVVTALLSNDGTILLLTPALAAATRRAQIPALPLLFACAFVANAASFVLPISNPANLVVFRTLPTLGPWFSAFGLPSLAALLVTFAVLRGLFRTEIDRDCARDDEPPRLDRAGAAAGCAIAISVAIIVATAATGFSVGIAAFVTGALSIIAVSLFARATPARVLRAAPWSIVPLVAGLFVIVQALDRSGILMLARRFFVAAGTLAPLSGNLLTGFALAAADNVFNNLPVGVITRYALRDHVAPHVVHAALVGVDLGPNLSVTGSLATILWLMTLRREGIHVSAWQFLRIGALVCLPSLAIALALVR